MTRRVERALLASCSIVYLAVATRLTDGLLRRQFDNGAYSHFFDYQAEAFLRGDLALPHGAIGIEAFVVDGHEQMYFGIFPAIIRMPILAVTDAFFGDLTLLSSFGAWLVFVASAWKLADAVLADLIDDEPSMLQRWMPWVWKVTIALGSPMLMLAGPAWVFSEAIMWGVAAAVFFQYRLWCEIRHSTLHNQIWLGGALLLAVLNRPTHALGCLGALVVLLIVRTWRRRAVSKASMRLGAIAVVGAVVMVLPNWLRFHRLFGLPMDAQVLSQVEAYRMRMLAYAGNDYTDIRYLPSNVLAYLRPDGLSVDTTFPFIGPPRHIPTVFLGAVHDITNRTPSIVASAPLLFLLALLGVVVALATIRSDAARRRTLFIACAGIPGVGAHLVWGFITPRFIADFVPLLLPLSLIGLAAVIRRLDRSTSNARRWSLAGLVVLAGWSVLANVGLALEVSYYTGYDGDVNELVRLQGHADFWTSESTVRLASPNDFRFDRDDPPPPDMIAVLGACEAAYVSNGEQVDPWLGLGYGDAPFRRTYHVTLPDTLPSASLHLATFVAQEDPGPDRPGSFHVSLATDGDGEVRIDLADEFGIVEYPLDSVSAGGGFDLTITSDPVRHVLSFDVDGTTLAYGYPQTRSLYSEAGQSVEFVDDVERSGVEVTTLDAPQPC